ncbi:MAG: aromatic ring-hydroxylating dioxygenase subunit alpha [Alphaproteobacteria bacterium]|nr:aromatic ring-hydroxylating dioxygenase subunit alpha [Alphaproteobacteria bacterium]MBV9692392.1 aromatic ring-hydroxylating dioxygenase subunit alpha [Alphaproteobacteria bacterium]
MNEIVRPREPETLPARAYWAEEDWAIERREIWAKNWVLVGGLEDLRDRGDYISAMVAGYPIVVIKSDEKLNAFHNVCRHRASPLVLEACGHLDKLTCPYHGWRYGLDGTLLHAPAMHLEKSEYGLFGVRCETWRGLVFVCLDATAPSLEQWMQDVSEAALRFPLERMHLARKLTLEADVNWKTYADNYAEGWHVPTIHPGLNASIDMASYRVETLGSVLQKHSAQARDGGLSDGLWLWRLPGFFINMYSWGMSVEQIEPVGPRKLKLHYCYYFIDPKDAKDEVLDWSLSVVKEDIAICERVQKNLEAGIYDRGRLSLVFENGVVQFQEFVEQSCRGQISA